MRHSGILTTLIITLFLTIPLTSSADTQWNVGVSGGDNGIDQFYISKGKDPGKYNQGQDPKYDAKGKDPKGQGKENVEWMNQGQGQKPL